MAEIGRALAPGGELFVQTDIFALALDAMAALEADAGASSTPRARGRSCATNPYGAKSRRERQCETEGVAHLAAAVPARGPVALCR